MSRQEEWQAVLDAEVERWSGISCEQLIALLCEVCAYEVEADSKRYQVEVEIIENKRENVLVSIGVDDGSLPWSIQSATRTFIKLKSGSD